MLPASVRIFVCMQPQDMRRSFDGLALTVRELLKSDPQDGALYVFFGKRSTRIKVLWWDHNGFCLLSKRLHRALFRAPSSTDGEVAVRVDASAFAELIRGVACEEKRTKRLTPKLH